VNLAKGDVMQRSHINIAMMDGVPAWMCMYAGSLFLLADFAGGVIFFTPFTHARYFSIVKEVTIRDSCPATSSVTVELELTSSPPNRADKY